MKYIVQIMFIMMMAINHQSAIAQNPVKEIGKVTKVEINTQLVNITTDNAFASVIVYSPDIIRVRIDKQPLKPDFSYAVVSQPVKTNVNITENNFAVTLVTDSLKAIIQKDPFSIAFYTLDGNLINEDETGLTTSWIGEEVTTYKKMQDGEHFIGLGEKTGNLDRNGTGYTNWNSDLPYLFILASIIKLIMVFF